MNHSEKNLMIYGAGRSLEPKDVLPTTAWKVDNSKGLRSGEMRVSLRKIMIEPASFRQIRAEAGDDPERIKARIMDIIVRRGKMQNPVTNTGGLLYGVIEEMDPDYENTAGLKPGDEIICNSSLASIPLLIEKISRMDRTLSLIDAEGYAILFSKTPVVKKPAHIPAWLLIFISNESGTLYNVGKMAAGKHDFLVLGDHIITNLMFGRAIRRTVGRDAHIMCLLESGASPGFTGGNLKELIGDTFDEVHESEILRPVACITEYNLDGHFDMTVNCADLPGSETINVIATKNGGAVVYANIINNYGDALYMTEAISRDLQVEVADGFLEPYDAFDIALAEEVAPAFDGVQFVDEPQEDYIAHISKNYPITGTTRGGGTQGYRNSLADGFVCESAAMRAVLDDTLRVAKYDCNVLIIVRGACGPLSG